MGQGVFDLETPTTHGSVISLSGGLETTSSHVITVTGSGQVEGLCFYYPTEVGTNTSPAITATGYVVRLSSSVGSCGAVRNNYFFNVPYAISNSQGWSDVSYNRICATKVAIHDDEEFAEHYFNFNQITVGFWADTPYLDPPGMRAWIAQNAIAFKLEDTLATFTGNHIFGYKVGFQFEGYAGFTNINGGLLDNCRYCVFMQNSAGPMSVTFTGVNFSALTAARFNGSRMDYASLESNVVHIQSPAAGYADFNFVGCDIGGACGDIAHVANIDGTNPVNLSISGGQWRYPGWLAHTYTMPVTSVVGTFTPSIVANDGDVITGGTSGATAIVRKIDAGVLYLDGVTGTFTPTETVTGSLSGATATVTSIAQGSWYRMVNYQDEGGGNLSVQGVRCDMGAYLWAAGISVPACTGQVDIQGNTFYSSLAQNQACLWVEEADRLVKAGNSSDIPAGNNDVIVTGVTNHTKGHSSWSRPCDPIDPMLTSKGDLLVRGTSGLTRQPVGLVNGQVISVDSVQSTGLSYVDPTAASFLMIPKMLSLDPDIYWALDEDNGITDLSGNGRNGTANGGVTIGGDAGLFGVNQGTNFDGTNDNITSSYAPFTNGTTRTFMGWAYRDTSGSYDVLFGSTGATNDAVIVYLASGTDDFTFYPGGWDGASFVWPDAWPENARWVHWAFVFNETANTVDLYINGRLFEATTGITEPYSGSPGNFKVGDWGSGADAPWDGKQCHVAVFERAVTPTEIAEVYRVGVAGAPPEFGLTGKTVFEAGGGETDVARQPHHGGR